MANQSLRYAARVNGDTSPEDPLFILLSFEGPDPYARAGGLASRETELCETLAALGCETHLFFVGDPSLPGTETLSEGLFTLHRWGQWISRYHPGGVYDGEEGKRLDWNSSLPPWVASNLIAPAVRGGRRVVVMAEEWHTAESVISLRHLVDLQGIGKQVQLLWNANNTFGFDRIDWQQLQRAATITTISRYMRTLLGMRGVEAKVVPNGVSDTWLARLSQARCPVLSDVFKDRLVLTKVARWDPDKNWDMTVSAVGTLKRLGLQPLLLARGGVEPYGMHVQQLAAQQDLQVQHARWEQPGVAPMVEAVLTRKAADVVVLDSRLDQEQSKFLYKGSFAVLANSEREPFGLVGLEAMASGGLALVGSTGEDYATNGYDAVCVQSKDPWELVRNIAQLVDAPAKAAAIRQAARNTATRFTWDAVVKRVLFPILGFHRHSAARPASFSARCGTHGNSRPSNAAVRTAS